MDTDRENKIRQRAYDLWLREGSPEGREYHHWYQAEQEAEAEEASPGGGSATAQESPESESAVRKHGSIRQQPR